MKIFSDILTDCVSRCVKYVDLGQIRRYPKQWFKKYFSEKISSVWDQTRPLTYLRNLILSTFIPKSANFNQYF